MTASIDVDPTDERLLSGLVAAAAHTLSHAGIDSPRFDAEVLLAHALDVERSGLATLLVMGARADDAQVAAFEALVQRRASRVPLQHLTGRAPFRRIELSVGPGVFVPRPETELVAGYAIEWCRLHGLDAARVIDLCSGSGAIAASIAVELPQASVVAVERDDDAVLWLRRNIEELELRDRVEVLHADARHVSDHGLRPASFDVVVTNPPYVPDAAIIRDPEAAEHDPPAALWGGPDGLDVVRGLERQAAALLRPGGLLVIEHADVQGAALPALLAAAPDSAWVDVVDHPDLNERPRYTVAIRAGDEPGTSREVSS
jgi:release factor glutamine methyltransferase